MYMNSSAASNGSYSLTFLGKKVGRHHSVAPSGKQIAWEASPRSTCPEGTAMPARTSHIPAVQALEDLPGSVPELMERPRPIIHNEQFETHEDNTVAVVHHKTSWSKKWAAIRRWMGTDRRKRNEQEVNQGPSVSQLTISRDADQGTEEEKARNDKIYIPYETAELCIAQISEDMKAMKKRHLAVVQELEESFRVTAQESQEWMIQKVRSHYQNKLNSLRRILNLYQETVEMKRTEYEKQVKGLKAQIEQLKEEQRAERMRNSEETLQWHREKSKMLELFSTRLDTMHNHQASTLQELQLTRQEIGRVQEMFTATQQEAVDGDENRTKDQQTETCSDSEYPLEGANVRLKELKEILFQREKEICELLEMQRNPIPPLTQPPCSVLLPTVIFKAHQICTVVPETTALLDQMIRHNLGNLVEARDKLNREQNAKESCHDMEADGSSICESSLSVLRETVRELEVCQIALECIKSGETPVNECEMSELEDVLGQNADGEKTFGQQLLLLQDQLKQEKEEKKKIIENYTTERTMRKKYYNMVEDMKGKIRVFCRVRPVNKNEATQGGAIVVDKLDEYSVTVETPRGLREFQFDKVFNAEASQEELFQDSYRLIQSVIDGYNVCIFAYGQTGSGKTFTMVGDKDQKNPGVMPRSFNAIFDMTRENSAKFSFKVTTYMLELYNDRLQDLLVSQIGEVCSQTQSNGQARRVEIKRNRKGVVFAQGAETKEASSAQELYALFQQACANRHISATKMNVESSRSHLIVGIMVESRNLTNGSVSTGKLSLVDLAGSERAAKTGAKDHQLKEANSINKSLSALGDVISALSSDLPHVPYRNSKLTQVMQDSLGGNAKTLMIVNVSPSECNVDETLTSLIYATRVKAISNNVQKNVESKEIAQLKEVIMKLRAGQTVEDSDI